MPAKKELELVDTTIRLLQDIRGYVSPGEFYYLLALILCFSEKGMLDDRCRYVPDPSNKNCYFLSEIWKALAPSWEKFIARAGEEKARSLVNIIRDRKYTPANKLHMLDSYSINSLSKSDAFYTQPTSITLLGNSLLNYQGGTVYNPFAGTASYGLTLKIGNKYFGEEFEYKTWAVGAIKLLLAKSPSQNFVAGNSFNRIGKNDIVGGYNTERFNYVISTPPFGMRVPDNRSMVAEDILLSKADQLLTPLGTMVMFALAGITTKSGKLREIRQRLTENNRIDTVIALPKDAFQPITSVATVALILKTDRDNVPVKFLDARDCIENKVLKVSEILKRLGDPNFFHEISTEQIREHDYSWHPAVYEDEFIGAPEEGYERIRLKDVLVQTGRPAMASGKQCYLAVSDLSSDPCNYRKSINDIEEKGNLDSRSVEATTRLREESLMSIRNLEIQKDKLQKSIERREAEMKSQETLRTANQAAKAQRMSMETERLDAEYTALLKDLEETSNVYKNEVESSANGKGINHSYLFSLGQKKDLLQKRLDDIKEEQAIKQATLEKEYAMEEELAYIQTRSISEDINNDQHRLREIDEQIMTIQKRIDSSIRELTEQASRELIQITHPTLFLGGRKPKVKFAYIEDVSSSHPVFLTSKNLSAFKVDTSRIDLNYLVYLLSTIEFKDLGEMVPMITANEILNLSLDILSDIEEQKAFVQEALAVSNPLYKEIESIKKQYLTLFETERKAHQEYEAKLLASLGSKQHDLGNLCPNVILNFADLYDSVEALSDEIAEKQALLKQINIISAEIKDMNDIIAIISEREDFPEPSKLDIINFLEDYIESHPSNKYYVEPLHYDVTEMEALGEKIFVNSSDIALTRAILNIRENADMHGFEPDARDIKHFLSISLKVDLESDTCIIDFSNNGLPMPEGMDDKRYGTRGEKAGGTAHTGNGGWYVSEMAKFYGGSCHVNPSDAEPGLVTIRLTLPLSHE